MQPYAYPNSAPDEIYFYQPAGFRDINVLKCAWMDAQTQKRQLKTNPIITSCELSFQVS